MKFVITVAVVILALMLTVPVSHAQILPTPTPTPTATRTPTPTITPTPAWINGFQTSSGDTVILVRQVTYGDVVITALLMLLISVNIIGLMYRIVRR